ncbi:MAG: hypothetical protein KDE14_06130 [Rhodobacteraceae bacterium]|nr:hypothetical protein [Paracoccaceae bacterium]
MCAAIDRTQCLGERKELICFGAHALDNGAATAVIARNGAEIATLSAKAQRHGCHLFFGACVDAGRNSARERALILIEPTGRLSMASREAVKTTSAIGAIALVPSARLYASHERAIISGADIRIFAPVRGAELNDWAQDGAMRGNSIKVTTVNDTVAKSLILGTVISGPVGEIRAAVSSAWEQVVAAELSRPEFTFGA